MKRNTVGIGFGAPIVHNCVQSICDALPTDAEATVVEIYAHLHVCIVSASVMKLPLCTELYCSTNTSVS
jgi:hypothetical protein